MSPQYDKARKRVARKKKFYHHLRVYLVMAGFFFILNMITDPFDWWFYWPMFGWGVGLAFHYLSAFGFGDKGVGSAEWEEKELAKEMHRLGGESPRSDDFDIHDHLELRDLDKKPEKVKSPPYDERDLV